MYLMSLITLVCSLQEPSHRTACLRAIDSCVWHWERIDTKLDNVEQKVFTCYRELYGLSKTECSNLLDHNPGYNLDNEGFTQ